MAYYGEDKVGSIRFEDNGEAIKVNVMLNPDFIGRGLGSEVIRLGTEKLMKEKKPERCLIAEIKKDNIASIKAFQKAGFRGSHVTFIYQSEGADCARKG